ncbi:MAG: hypothetical protein R3F56_13280 [Planctomycetota bacterium]
MQVHTFVPTILSLLVSASVSAQALQGGDLVVSDYQTRGVYRIDGAGSVSPLQVGAPLTSPSGLAVGFDLSVYVADYNTGTIYRIPPGGTIATFATGVSGAIRLGIDLDGSLLATSLTQQALLHIDGGGNVTTIASGAPFIRPFDVIADVDGSYLVADDGFTTTGPRVPALYRVTRTGVVTPIWQGAPLQLAQGVALFADGDYAIMDGLVDAVFRLPRSGGTPTPIVTTPAIDNPDGIAADFEGGFVLSESSSAGSRIDRVDRHGNVTNVVSGAPFSNLEDIARAPRLSGPDRLQMGQTGSFRLNFGGEGGRPYLMWASLSVYPGLAFPGIDVRAIPGNPDALFLTSIAANDPVFVAWSGTLSASGTAAPQLALPNLALGPLTFHLQALTVQASYRNSIRSISNLHLLQL